VWLIVGRGVLLSVGLGVWLTVGLGVLLLVGLGVRLIDGDGLQAYFRSYAVSRQVFAVHCPILSPDILP
jgi:hypothetical protein